MQPPAGRKFDVAEKVPMAAAAQSHIENDPGTSALVAHVTDALSRGELRVALKALNRAAGLRFTAVYRFDGETLKSLALFDRDAIGVQIWPDVPVRDSYCTFLRRQLVFVTEDAEYDPAVAGHPKQGVVFSYCGAALRGPDGTPWGSICHFDYVPHTVSPADVAVLEQVAPAFYSALSR